jgi:hypothetical protein
MKPYVVFWTFFVAASAINPAFGQQSFNSREGFHGTAYGTLAFNREATTQFQSRYEFKNYIVVADGVVTLPKQSAYCFVINHYNSDNAVREYRYTFQVSKWYAGRSEPVTRSDVSTYTPTNDPRSLLMPDYCLSRSFNVTKIEVRTSSTEGPDFDHRFSFDIAP